MRYATALVLLVSSFNAAHGAGRELDPELKDLNSDQTIDVIVQYRSAPTAADHHRVLARGGQLKNNLDIIRAAHYSLPADQLQALSDDPGVEFIAPDRAVKATGNSAYMGPPDYGWEAVGANLATSVFGLDGTGIGIALMDSGANNDEDVKNLQGQSRFVYQTSLVPNSDPNDHYGHAHSCLRHSGRKRAVNRVANELDLLGKRNCAKRQSDQRESPQ